MKNSDKLYQMFELQLQLNNNTNGLDWIKGYTKNSKLIDWNRCIYMESAELIDSFAWKHWKNIDSHTDWENVHIELVDIWHFILSLKLVQNTNIETQTQNLINNSFISTKEVEKETNIYLILDIARNLIHNTSSSAPSLSITIDLFFALAKSCGMSFDLLYKLYIAKNVLNKFRQDHGYKLGEYIKIWNGKEDNQILMQILDNNQNISFEFLYKELTIEYKKVK